ncbi:MAG: biotin/lipoyl-binding protein [Chloroflexi bacterium]|nr:biotin/lipoyl-binding protein [Chloroflexota bacterium]
MVLGKGSIVQKGLSTTAPAGAVKTVTRGGAAAAVLKKGFLGTPARKLIVVGLVALVAGGAVVASRATSAPPKVELRTQPVAVGGVTQTVAVSGSVSAAAQTKLNFQLAGKLSDVYVSVGQKVTAGQPLAKLDTSDLQVALNQAKANLASAAARYGQVVAGADPADIAQARLAVDNAQRSLESTQTSTSNDLTSAKQAVDNAEQSLLRLSATYSAARTNFSTIASGISADTAALRGVVGRAKDLTSAALSDIQTSGRTGSDVTAAKNALNSVNGSLTGAIALLDPLQAAYTEYATQSDNLLAAVAFFDRNTTGAGAAAAVQSYQTTLVAFNTAQSRFTDALASVNTGVSAAASSSNDAVAALNGATAKNYTDLDSARTDATALSLQLAGAVSTYNSMKARIAQSTSAVSTFTDFIVSGYVGAQNTLVNAQQSYNATQSKVGPSISSSQSALQNAQLSLSKVAAPPKDYDIAAAYAGMLTAQASVDTATNNLGYATLLAPTTGLIAQVNGNVGENVSGGGAVTATTSTGTAVNTTNTFILLANTTSIALHGTVGEAEVAKLRLGQVATITVDAVGAGTRMTGKVTGLDPLATLQQGVPVYGIDVTIDIPNEQVRPGMSGTANVIIASKQGVLTIPNLAIRSQGGRRIVQVLRDGNAVDVTDVTFGIATDSVTEVTNGLKEGDLVVLPQPRASASGSGRPVQIGGPPPGGGFGR